MNVFGLTNATQACVMILQAKICAADGTPLTLHFEVVEAVVGELFVVETFGVVELCFPLFFRALVQEAVTVICVLAAVPV